MALSRIQGHIDAIQKGIEWLRSNANISKALAAPKGAVSFRQSIIDNVHRLIKELEELTSIYGKTYNKQGSDLINAQQNVVQSLHLYIEHLLDLSVDAARAFHKAYFQLHHALRQVETFIQHVLNGASQSIEIAHISHNNSLTNFSSPQSKNAIASIKESRQSDTTRLTEEKQLDSKKTVGPPLGKLFDAVHYTKETRGPKLNHDLSMFNRRLKLEERFVNEDKRLDGSSGTELIEEIRALKAESKRIKKEYLSAKQKLLVVQRKTDNQIEEIKEELEIKRLKSEITRLKKHIEVLEEQNRSLNVQINNQRDMLKQFKSSKEPDFGFILEENLNLINVLAQERRQGIEVKFEDLKNEISSLHRRLKIIEARKT
ncbi:MAG: hypothetical protein ACTSVM_02235 [Candidatus Ranarchaeia archaeon]